MGSEVGVDANHPIAALRNHFAKARNGHANADESAVLHDWLSEGVVQAVIPRANGCVKNVSVKAGILKRSGKIEEAQFWIGPRRLYLHELIRR